jgi:glycosyltransferase involved in cell wall biosynthesis
MKVWFPTIQAGTGSDVFTIRLSEALRKRGIETEITWFNKYYELAPFFLKGKNPPTGTDIIHANTVNGFAFKRSGIPLVVTEFHCVFDPLYRPFKSFLQHFYHQLLVKRFESASFQLADAITAISASTKSSLESVFKLPDVQLIYLWVDTQKYKPLGKSGDRKKRPFRLLFVGNLSKRKGADLLEPIMQRLGNGFELRFTAGMRKKKRSSLLDNMTPLGRLSEKELIDEYQKCDALLFPSRFEGFGYVALEAMSCGKPVVATDSSSIPEVVENGVSGLLCPTDDIEAFVNACSQLEENNELCVKMGEEGRKRAKDVFAEDVIVAQYMNFYSEFLKKDKNNT